jgi:hypothetical protein
MPLSCWRFWGSRRPGHNGAAAPMNESARHSAPALRPGNVAIVDPLQNGIRGQLGAVVARLHLRLPVSVISRSSPRSTRGPEIELSAISMRHSRVQSYARRFACAAP